MRLPSASNRAFYFLCTLGIFLLILTGAAAWVKQAKASNNPQLYLQYATFDPLDGEPALAPALRLAEPGGQAGAYLVQFTGPVQEVWKAQVAALGGQLYGYVPDYAFLARLDAQSSAAVQALPFVRWVGAYHPAYRLSPGLNARVNAAAQAGADLEAAEMLQLTVETLPDADMAGLSAQTQALGGQVQAQTANTMAGYLRLSLPAGNIAALAGLDGVIWVEEYLAPSLHNDIGGGQIMNADVVRQHLGLTGAGQVVGIADSGLDTGNKTTLHPDVLGRVINADADICLGRPSPCDWSDYVSHGTHVAGSVLGNGTVSGGQYRGAAPGAQLVFQAVGDALGGLSGIPADEGDLMRSAYADGARIHTNSWGGPSGGSLDPYGDYIVTSQQIDQAMWELKDMLVLFSAGNSGEDDNGDGRIDPDSIGQPGTAKNVLTVGASENYRPTIPFTWGTDYGAPIDTDKMADNANGLAAFSSRGPTDDGRIKPDIVAPGTYILSMRTRQYAFNDQLEAGTGGYIEDVQVDGGTGSNIWSLKSDSGAHSASHYWEADVQGSFADGAMTVLQTPAFDVRPTGGTFDVHFWHKFNLGSGDRLAVLVFNEDTGSWTGRLLGESGSQSAYTLRSVTLSIGSFIVPPSQVRIAFGIFSDGDVDSTWQIDDIRVDGADWGTLSGLNLANPGDTIDEAYLAMGGTSMSTPLTAGAVALVREWLTAVRTMADPSGALMKAVLINGAADMSPGQYTSPQEVPAARPNNVSGWGRVDLHASLNPEVPRQVYLQDNKTGLTTGAAITYTLAVGPSTPPGVLLSEPRLQTTPVASDSPASNKTVELSLSAQALGAPILTNVNTPQASAAAVSLVLDDGSIDDAYGVNSTSAAFQFIWLNRFTPAAAEFPFQLEQIQVLFAGSGVSVGDAIDLVVYQDADGNPANGATHLATIPVTVQSVDGSTWSVYNLASPVFVTGPGDVLIGAINRFVNDNVSAPSYAASIDTSSGLERSWIGWWVSIPPDPAILPPDLTFELMTGVDAGNWMIRGYGSTTITVPTPTTPAPTVPPPTATPLPDDVGGPLRLTLAWTDYPGVPLAAKALVNDLDLELIAPNGTHYYGNSGLYNSGQCLRSGLWDACNNVEGILIPNAQFGAYTVVIHGVNIPSGPQPFALVASGDYINGEGAAAIYLPMVSR